MFKEVRIDEGTFLVGPVIKTLPSNEGDADLIPGWEGKSHMTRGQEPKY